jgi:hypothetical protein
VKESILRTDIGAEQPIANIEVAGAVRIDDLGGHVRRLRSQMSTCTRQLPISDGLACFWVGTGAHALAEAVPDLPRCLSHLFSLDVTMRRLRAAPFALGLNPC